MSWGTVDIECVYEPNGTFWQGIKCEFSSDIWPGGNRFNRFELPSSSTGLVDVCTKTSPRNRTKFEQNVLAGLRISHHRTCPEKTGVEIGNGNL
jgi:hypothetical protein